MNKSDKIVRVVAFMLSSVITTTLFSAFVAWAMSRLDPVQREVIAHAVTPRPLPAGESPKVIQLDPITVVGHATDADRSSAAVASEH